MPSKRHDTGQGRVLSKNAGCPQCQCGEAGRGLGPDCKELPCMLQGQDSEDGARGGLEEEGEEVRFV